MKNQKRSSKKTLEIKATEVSSVCFEAIESRLKRFFKRKIYLPLFKELGLPKKILKNADHDNPLVDALFRGQISYQDGKFVGEFNATLSKELKRLGARFKKGAFYLEQSALPMEIRNRISASHARFLETLARVDERLGEILPDELAAEFQCADLFDLALWDAEKDFKKNVKKLVVIPELTPLARKRIAQDWQENMNVWIRGWTREQIKDMRAQLLAETLGGASRESHVAPILKVTQTLERSHEQAMNKAQFLARQETRLMMATFKQQRYEEAGSRSYIWRCVHRPHDESPKHHTPGNVRYSHGKLDGKEFLWSAPPITTNPGEPMRRNHAGQDYRCRCFSRPLIRVSVEEE